MSFRPFNLDVYRCGLAGFVCLACVWTSHAGDGGWQPIEVVPPRGTAIGTNIDASQSIERDDLQSMGPRAPHPFQPAPASPAVMMAPQPHPVAPTERQRELLDRRRNWVFMSPEEFALPDSESDSSIADDQKDGTESKPTTAMQRYYQHLYDADRMAATNQTSHFDPDRWNSQTNSFTGGPQNGDRRGFADSPFNAPPEAGVFRSLRANDISDAFGLGADTATPNPETVRIQAEQKTHIDSFKQLWNIDQPPVMPTASVASTPAVRAPASSANVFNTPENTQPVYNPMRASLSGFSTQPQPMLGPPTLSSSRNSAPPHADFAPPQRPF